MENETLEGFRLSPQQARLWLLEQADHSPAYGTTGAILIEGKIERNILKSALEVVIHRHEILRTVFRRLPGMRLPLQVVIDSSSAPVQECDLTGLDSAMQNAKVEEFYHALQQTSFDFQTGPLLRLVLVVLSPQKHVLLLSLPGLCADSRTLENLVFDIGRCYGAQARRESLRDEPKQYADLSEWQNVLLEESNGEKRWRCWPARRIASLKLPFEDTLSATAPFMPQCQRLEFSFELLRSIDAIARASGVSVRVFVQTCWHVLLSYLAGNSDTVVGTRFSGRKNEELRNALGPFARYLPIGVQLDGGSRFSEVLKILDSAIHEAYEWQDYFAWEEVQGDNDDDGPSRFFAFCFDFVKEGERFTDGNVIFALDKQTACPDRFKVKLSCVLKGELTAQLHYDSNLFRAEDIGGLAVRFLELLDKAAKHPEVTIGDLEVLSGIKRERRLSIAGGDVGLDAVEAALRTHPLVTDCAVLPRNTEGSEIQLVAYVVFAGSLAPEQLRDHLKALLPSHIIPHAYVLLSNLPLTASGQVDEQTLSRIEVIDADLIQQWRERLKAVTAVDQCAVVVEECSDILPPLHVSDLLPEWRVTGNSTSREMVPILPRSNAAHDKSEPRAPALSYGGQARKEDGAPTTLLEALLRAALQAPEKGIVYVQSNGTEMFQSYQALLEEAKRILAGLKKLGLKAQDKVIFQLDRNQDFIPAFWASVLGGLVPVPLSVAPTYRELNHTVYKLRNAWQNLDSPIILTSRTLASQIRSLSELLHLENFQVETIEDLRVFEPNHDCHLSRPEDLAVLLLTSGSTGMPKGVMLTHRNILSNVSGSVRMNGFSSEDISLNWMPLDHVGSLVRCLIRDVFMGSQQIHAPTEAVIQDPLRWLDWMERYRVTVTWAPNFAFGLINDRARTIRRRRWNLSSVRFLLNTGEPIVAKTAKCFLELLAPHGLSPRAMYSAWGMSETSSGVTFSNSYLSDSCPEGSPFVEVGPPISGISLRIVNAEDQVVEEDTIGRLQVKGSAVTFGYYRNSELNREILTPDGWFTTGDLGFLHKGRLTISGREKDIVIVNGVNYYSHEIESVVEGLEGVEVSYTAACAIRDSRSSTDQLAIFFHTLLLDEDHWVDMLSEIRKTVARNIGISPTYLIPLEKHEVPKTAIGKIQRSRLRERFEAGEFDSILKRMDILSGAANTVPDWFYRRIWRRRDAVSFNPQVGRGYCLLFLDELGLGARVCAELKKAGMLHACVEKGSVFAKLASGCYQIDPKNPDHYQALLESLSKDRVRIQQVLHLWNYYEYAEISSLEVLQEAQDRGVYSLLLLTQALARAQGSGRPVQLLVISSHTQSISPNDEIAYEKTPMLGLIRTLPREILWLKSRHVDLPLDSVEVNAARIVREIQTDQGDQEVAYRNGRRLVPRLEKVDLLQEEKRELPFKPGGMYLLSGGLGGIGLEVAKYLLKHYGTRLLVIGRTPLPERDAWERHLSQKDAVSDRIAAYLSLEQLGTEIIYEAVDVCDLPQLQRAVNRARSHWRCELDGVIHLAGIARERSLIDETPDSVAATLRPKVLGTWALHQLIKDQPHSVFVSFSSIIGSLGATLMGAYAAANSFLCSFSRYQRHKCSLQSHCFEWSMWDEVGMARYHQMKELVRAQGRQLMSIEQGMCSFLAALRHDQEHLLIGLNGGNHNIQRYTETKSYRAQKLVAYLTTKANHALANRLQDLEVRDRFGTRSSCDFLQVREIPLTESGEIDREKLRGSTGPARRAFSDRIAPRTSEETQIASVWQEVLGVPQVGVHDNFFLLGGHSLLAIRVISLLREIFQVELSLRSLFERPTVAGLAEQIEATLWLGQGRQSAKDTMLGDRTEIRL